MQREHAENLHRYILIWSWNLNWGPVAMMIQTYCTTKLHLHWATLISQFDLQYYSLFYSTTLIIISSGEVLYIQINAGRLTHLGSFIDVILIYYSTDDQNSFTSVFNICLNQRALVRECFGFYMGLTSVYNIHSPKFLHKEKKNTLHL